jgi:hypothetical protein
MNTELLGFIRRSRADAMRRLDEIGRHHSTSTPTTVDRIDDPDGRCAIVVVRGPIDADSLSHLWDAVARIADASTILFDLTDASIHQGPWMHELGILVDAVEDAGGDVGVVGLDPEHPDLWPRP